MPISVCFSGDPSISIAEHLASAKKTLREKIFFIAILERFKESIDLLSKKLGWTPIVELSCRNTTEAWYQEYPQELIDLIAQRNWADIELYQFALELFEAQKLDILALPNPLPIDPSWCSGIHYTFDQPLVGSGWCQRQNSKENPSGYRWMRHSEQSWLDFPLTPDRDYRLICEVCFTDSIEQNMRVYVNDHLLRHSLTPKNGEWQELRADIPQCYLCPNQVTRVTFEIVDPNRLVQLDPYRGRCGFKCVDILP